MNVIIGIIIPLVGIVVIAALLSWQRAFTQRKIAAMMSGTVKMPNQPIDPLSCIEILPNNKVRLLVTRAEMGQGIHTGLAQIVAEELEVPLECMEVVHSSDKHGYMIYRGTMGSMSMHRLYYPLRRAAAEMREMLRIEASRLLGQPIDKLVARNGRFEVIGDEKLDISYSEIAQTKPKWQKLKGEVKLKNQNQFNKIGKSLHRTDGIAKVTGKAVFGYDVSADGMLHGAVVRPPKIGAKMRSADTAKAELMPGVVKVVAEKDFVGVVAKTRAEARAARDKVEVDWEIGHIWQQQELENIVTVGTSGGASLQRRGKARRILKNSRELCVEYSTRLLAHASMETQSALAVHDNGKYRIWASTQFELISCMSVARTLGVSMKDIEIIPTYLGGGFGRKGNSIAIPTAEAEAARLARAVGAPVHISWDRKEEFQCGFLHPMTKHKLSAKLDNGKIEAVQWLTANSDTALSTFKSSDSLWRIIGYDPGGTRGAWFYYDIPNIELTAWRRKIPVPTGQFRGLGLTNNLFALESFMDEAAYAAGKGPISFRLDHLPNNSDGQRMRAVIEAVAEKADWETALPHGHGKGIAHCLYDGTFVALIAEISVEESTGRIKFLKFTVAMDCGIVINPDLVCAQVEGAVIMGASAAMEEIRVKDGVLTSEDFSKYTLITSSEVPQIETILIASERKPTGCGETPIGPVAPAIANAIYSAIGVRIRKLPLTSENVRKAVKIKESKQ